MLRRIFAIVLVVLGLATIGAAIASGTIWRPDEQVTLSLPSDPDVPLVLTEPGVLSAVDDVVEVRLVGAAEDTPVMLAMGRESDVLAWVADAPHWTITGLTDWETLSYVDSRDETEEPSDDATSASTEPSSDASASEEASSEEPSATEDPSAGADDSDDVVEVPDPAGSDLWVEEVDGTGEVTYSWTEVPGRWVMLIASDGTTPAPQVELTWHREVATPFVRPGIILGSVVALLGLVLLIVQLLSDIERRRARKAAAAETESTEVIAAVTADGDRPLTRREIRLAAAAAAKDKGKPGAEGEDADSDERQADGDAEGVDGATQGEATEDEATEDEASIDDWIRSGSASPLMHEGERTTPDDLALSEEESASLEPGSETAGSEAEPAQPDTETETRRRGSWWRRRRDSAAAASEAADETASTATDASSGPAEKPGSQTEEIAAVVPDEDDGPSPEVSGASWRETWGLGAVGDDQGDAQEEDR